MKDKVSKLLESLDEVEGKLADPVTLHDRKLFKELSQKHKFLCTLRDTFDDYERCKQDLLENKELLKGESDLEFIEVIQEDVAKLQAEHVRLESNLKSLLVPPDTNDDRNVIIEIRAGTGGDEAAIFAGDCVRMYQYYAQIKGFKIEQLSCSESEQGGYREYQAVFSGTGVHRSLQYEAGTHRVQRVPTTESGGRVHTSAVTVAVIMEPDQEEKISLDEKDLRIDTYRSSGAGGQHVNTTDSAVRITHIPTGIVAHCQQERSQIKNRAKAMRLLEAKIVDEKRRTQEQEISSLRSSQVGSGDRSERIRTYNYPQNRITDHRISLTLYKLAEIMQGNLDQVVGPLLMHFYNEKLRA
jgi:peptide chain release factor 1